MYGYCEVVIVVVVVVVVVEVAVVVVAVVVAVLLPLLALLPPLPRLSFPCSLPSDGSAHRRCPQLPQPQAARRKVQEQQQQQQQQQQQHQHHQPARCPPPHRSTSQLCRSAVPSADLRFGGVLGPFRPPRELPSCRRLRKRHQGTPSEYHWAVWWHQRVVVRVWGVRGGFRRKKTQKLAPGYPGT